MGYPEARRPAWWPIAVVIIIFVDNGIKSVADPESVTGTLLRFRDETWDADSVELRAVFSRMQVTVNGKPCPNVRFVSDHEVALAGIVS